MPEYDEYLEGKESSFNEAKLKMIRLHELQQKINFCNLNPLIHFPEENLYGYQIIFNSLKSLFSEVHSKLSSDKKIKGKTFVMDVQTFMQNHPIHIKDKNKISHTPSINVNYFAWEILKHKLFDLELLVKEYLEETGYSSPTSDDSGL